MKKSIFKNLILALFLIVGVGQMWGTTQTVGYTTGITTTSGGSTSRTLLQPTHTTVTVQFNSGTSGALAEYSTGDKAFFYGGTTSYFSQQAYKWNAKTGSSLGTSNNYIGFSVTIADGYQFTVDSISFGLAAGANMVWQVIIYQGTDTIYKGTETTISNYKNADAANYDMHVGGLSVRSALQNLEGTFYVRARLAFDGTAKYLCAPTFHVIGNLEEESAPSCSTPTAPTAFAKSSVTATTATFSITDAADAASYDIYTSTSSDTPDGETTPTATGLTTQTPTVTSLTSGTTYYAWVRAVCDESHKSSWVALTSSTFTTLATPTASFSNSTYAIGGSALDLSSLWSSNSAGTVTYSVQDAAGTGATVSTASFSATRAGKAKVKAVQAANGSYEAITKYAYITVGSNVTGKHTVTYDLEVNVNKSRIPVTDSVRSTSLYLTTAEADTLKGTGGLSYTGGAKASLTGKIEALASYDADKYVYVQFSIASGYQLTLDSAWCVVQAVGNGSDQNGKLVISDTNSHSFTGGEITCPGTKDGTPTHVVVKGNGSTAFTGTVTLKIYVYGTAATYRLGETINIHGNVTTTCTSITPSLSYASAGGTTLTVGDVSSAAPTITGNTGSGSVTFESSDEDVATVDEDGKVTAVAAGTATITATIAANGGYCEGEATADFTIESDCSTPADPDELTVGSITTTGATFTITDDETPESYDIYYSTSSTAPTSGTDATTTTTSKSKAVTGLTSGTTYYAWVRAVCDASNKSDWVALTDDTFTTLHQYAITYDAGEDGTGSISGGTKTEGESFTLSSSTFTRAGYTQIGWATSDGGTKAYDLGGSYTTDAAQTFYPFWAENTYSFAPTETSGTLALNATVATSSGGTMKVVGLKTTTEGKESISYDSDGLKFGGGGADSVRVTLEGRMQAGTVITAKIYNADASKARGLNLLTNSGVKKKEMTRTATGDTIYRYVVTASDGLDGTKVFRLQRSENAFLKSLTVANTAAPTYDLTVTVNDAEYGSVSPTSVTDIPKNTTTSSSSNTFTVNGTTVTATPTLGTAEYTYAFSSWSGLPATVTENATVTATFTRTANSYTLAWSTNGGSDLAGTPTTGTTAYGTSLTKPTDPTLSNYTFGGWNTANDGSGTNHTGAMTMPASDVTYYAKWTQAVTLDANMANHGSGDNTAATAVLNATGLSGFSATSAATNYAVTGYYTGATDGDKVLNADGSFASENVSGYITSGKWSRTGAAPTLYAHLVEAIYVTYDDNDATSGDAPTDATAYVSNAEVTVLGNTGSLTKTDKIFNGWNTAADGTGTFYPVGSKFKITADVTLYAVWSTPVYTTYYYGSVNISAGALVKGAGTSTVQFFTNTEGTIANSTDISVTSEPGKKGYYYLTNDIETSDLQTGSNYTTTEDTDTKANSYIKLLKFTSGDRTLKLGNRVATSIIYYGMYEGSSGQKMTIGGVEYTPTGTKTDLHYYEFTKAGGFTGDVTINTNTAFDGILVITAYTLSGVSKVTFDSNGKTATDMPESITNVPSGSMIAEPLEIPEAVGFTFDGWYKEPACSNEWDFSSDAVSANTTLYAKWVENNRHFLGTSTSAWGTAANWEEGELPDSKSTVYIMKPVTIATGSTRQVGQVVVVTGGSYTPDGGDEMTCSGKLTVEAGGKLIIEETLKKCTDASDLETLTATAETDLVINSDETNGLGALVVGSHDGTNEATVNFYTKSHGTKGSSASVSQYVGTPFGNEPAMLYQFYNSWMYKLDYDGDNNISTNVWARLNGDEGLKAFDGYCVISADGEDHVYEMSGTLCASTDVTNKTLKHGTSNTENMLANSWMAPIRIAAFESTDFTNTEATIYIFNSGSPSDYETNSGASTYGSLAGQYSAYTIGTAGNNVIPAMQAFSVYTTGDDPTITLDYSKLVYDPAVAGTASIIPNKAPRRAKTSDAEMELLQMRVEGTKGWADELRLYMREDFSEDFENGWDGHKMFGESDAPQLYAITPDGQMVINCIPEAEGTVVGFEAGTADNVYSFSFSYNGEQTLYLNDLKEQESTLIADESTYLFTSEPDDAKARFMVSATPIRKITTGVEGVGENPTVRKLLIEDKLFIIRSGRMYGVDGSLVK